MKRSGFLALLLAAVVVFTLAGCGVGGGPKADTDLTVEQLDNLMMLWEDGTGYQPSMAFYDEMVILPYIEDPFAYLPTGTLNMPRQSRHAFNRTQTKDISAWSAPDASGWYTCVETDEGTGYTDTYTYMVRYFSDTNRIDFKEIEESTDDPTVYTYDQSLIYDGDPLSADPVYVKEATLIYEANNDGEIWSTKYVYTDLSPVELSTSAYFPWILVGEVEVYLTFTTDPGDPPATDMLIMSFSSEVEDADTTTPVLHLYGTCDADADPSTDMTDYDQDVDLYGV